VIRLIVALHRRYEERDLSSIEEFYAARDERNRARAHLDAMAGKLEALGNTLRDQRGVRLNEMTSYSGPAPNHIIVDKSELVRWEDLELAVRAYTRADDRFRRLHASLTADQRRQISATV
jgi:hypothetical protein